MSAITAIVHWDGRPVERGLLDAANACVRHRCPDGAWSWVDGRVGLAQADLATLPEDTPGLPVVLGRLRIAASCRIDNRDELRGALPGAALPPDAPDAAYILAAYRAWGDACVERLIGDFAFVIWDADRRRLFAARDIFGTQQLFYYRRGDHMVVASDRTQIFQDRSLPLEVDEEQLIEYLTPTFQWTSGWDLGMLKNVFAVPAGCTLSAENGRIDIRRYWEWRDRAPDRRPESEVLKEYLHLLDQAVRCRLRTRDARVGIELSGGLDSPAIAALAARIPRAERPELHSFSLVFDEVPEVDERHRIQPVLDRYDLNPHFIVADRLYSPKCLRPEWSPQGISGPHEMMGAPALDHLHAAAVQMGCRVMLTGLMGDAINSGWQGVFYDLLRRGDIREIARRLKIDWQRRPRRALGAVAYYMLAPSAPWPLLRAGRAMWEHRKGMYEALPDYLTPQIRQRISEMDAMIRMRRVAENQIHCPSALSTIESTFPPMVALTRPTLCALERRHPYTDRRLVELVLSMPQDMKWEHEQRQFMRACRLHHRKAMTALLPSELLVGNVGVDFTPVIKHNMPQSVIGNWFKKSNITDVVERGYIVPGIFQEKNNGTATPYQELYGIMFFCIEEWLQSIKRDVKISLSN